MLWICPPLIITEKELGEGLDVIEDGLRLVDAELAPAAELVGELPLAAR
jgi:hypothetical protein